MISTGKSIPYILKAPIPFPLDGIDPSTFVYGGGFIQLLADYSGAAIRIRRSSDNAETDIGFTDGIVSPAEVEAFGSDCFLATIYDQVGTGVNWTQTTQANQLTVVKSGTAVQTQYGVVGALNEVGFFDCTTSNITYPKDFAAFDGYFTNGGGALQSRGGTWTVATQNQWRNVGYNNGAFESQHLLRSSGGGTLFSLNLGDTPSPDNGVCLSMYVDDTNGSAITRNGTYEQTPSWTANSRTAATSNKVYFNRLLTLSTSPGAQIYSILLDDPTLNTTIEDRINRVLGI